ncbi:hypothetical protein LSAT2_027386 [Lamellibrachia satsuma]|nr:hypothetical protein LSAT2_027386 [Lamellibrachia satsuma]
MAQHRRFSKIMTKNHVSLPGVSRPSSSSLPSGVPHYSYDGRSQQASWLANQYTLMKTSHPIRSVPENPHPPMSPIDVLQEGANLLAAVVYACLDLHL